MVTAAQSTAGATPKASELARRFVEDVLGGQDPATFDSLVADDVWVNTGLKPDGPILGKAEYGQILAERLGRVFSDGSLVIDEVLEISEDRALVRFHATATHSGELWGIPPTGRRIEMSEIHLMRFRDGKLVENFVGGLNPLSFEMLFAQAIAPMVLR